MHTDMLHEILNLEMEEERISVTTVHIGVGPLSYIDFCSAIS